MAFRSDQGSCLGRSDVSNQLECGAIHGASAIEPTVMLRDKLSIKSGLYRLPEDPLASEILVPAFVAAQEVSGAFGWFTSGWIRRLAPWRQRSISQILDASSYRECTDMRR